jgi:hypothetical protein
MGRAARCSWLAGLSGVHLNFLGVSQSVYSLYIQGKTKIFFAKKKTKIYPVSCDTGWANVGPPLPLPSLGLARCHGRFLRPPQAALSNKSPEVAAAGSCASPWPFSTTSASSTAGNRHGRCHACSLGAVADLHCGPVPWGGHCRPPRRGPPGTRRSTAPVPCITSPPPTAPVCPTKSPEFLRSQRPVRACCSRDLLRHGS